MLDMRSYTRQELIDIFKTDRLDSIKAKIQRRGYTYTTSGRGKDFTLTITGLPPRFSNFCIERLGFAPQTDFERLKIFLGYFFFDEEFRQLPVGAMAWAIEKEMYITYQTFSRWINKLIDKGIIHKSTMEFNYYACNENQMPIRITKELYCEAWREYWKERDYGYEHSMSNMMRVVGGKAHKFGVIDVNAFEEDTINELKEILQKEIGVNEQDLRSTHAIYGEQGAR